MKMGKLEICPLCASELDLKRCALSRVDNKTKICNKCGTLEALDPSAVKINRYELENYRKKTRNKFVTFGQMWVETRGI